MNEENFIESKEMTKQYQDYSGVDTESFIIETLREHPKDRSLLLSLEKFFHEFIQDDQQTIYQFEPMNSYERMIVHRVAAFFGLQHNTDKSGQCVIINKTSNMRIPNLSFRTVIDNQSVDPQTTTNRGPREFRKSTRPKSSSQPIVPMNSMAMPNYLPLIPSNGSAYYGAHGIPLTPILIQQNPNGPFQYVYPTVLSSDRPLTPIYRSDLLPPTPFLPFQYPTNQFAALTLQSPIRPTTTTTHRNFLGRPFVQTSTIMKKSRSTKSSD